MPRPSILLNIVLIVAVFVLFGLLQSRGGRAPDAHAAVSSRSDGAHISAAIGASPDGDALARATMERLQRIDARLAALEAGGDAASQLAPTPVRIDPGTAAEADRRVALLFSDREVDGEDWSRWQAALSEMPPAERFALGAAFARAVNRDRLALRF